MGVTIAKEKLYSAIESENETNITKIIQKFPNFINEPMTTDCKSTPLGRAAYRGNLKIVDLLINFGADINYTGPTNTSPLMWACIRSNIDVVNYLIVNGADISLLNPNKFNCLELAVIHGQYDCCLFLLEKKPELKDTLKEWTFYRDFIDETRFKYVNYELFLEHLVKKIPYDLCPSFYTKPRPPPLVDPVIDPRETWGQWFHRVLEFEEPPLVERSELPENLQPQNRAMGKIAHIINGKSPYPDNYYEQQELDNIKQQELERIQQNQIDNKLNKNKVLQSKNKEEQKEDNDDEDDNEQQIEENQQIEQNSNKQKNLESKVVQIKSSQTQNSNKQLQEEQSPENNIIQKKEINKQNTLKEDIINQISFELDEKINIDGVEDQKNENNQEKISSQNEDQETINDQ